MNVRRLSHVYLETAVNDVSDRSIMPMSTLIGTADQHEWLIETTWDGSRIGDAQIFRNKNVLQNGRMAVDKAGNPLPDDWKWWAGVPHGKIRSYRFFDISDMKPGTVEPELLELPFDGKRKTEPREARKAAVQSAATEENAR